MGKNKYPKKRDMNQIQSGFLFLKKNIQTENAPISFTTSTFIDQDLHSCPHITDVFANETVELIVSSLDLCLDWTALIVLLF